MRVCIISDYVSQTLGGHARNILSLAGALESAGCDVQFITISDPRNDHGGFSHRSVPNVRPALLGPSILMARVARELEKTFDVVHSNLGFGFPYAFRGRRPFFLHMRTSGLQLAVANLTDKMVDFGKECVRDETMALWSYLIELMATRKATKVICNSSETADAVRWHHMVNSKRVAILPNGVDLPSAWRRGRVDDTGQLLYVSRLSLTKGLHKLVRGFKIVHDARPQTRLCVAGDGRLLGKARQLAISLRVDEAVEFLGQVSREHLAKLYQDSDLFVCPSSPGTSVLEALSFGLPVVISLDSIGNCPGLDVELLRSRGVGSLGCDGEERFAERILTALSDSDWRAIQARRSREIASREFSWTRIAEELVIMYEETIAKSPSC